MKHVALFAAALTVAAAGMTSARAMPVPQAAPADGNITLVSGGCGPYGHRTPYGNCVGNYYRPAYRVCPPGFHLGPYGRACLRNY